MEKQTVYCVCANSILVTVMTCVYLLNFISKRYALFATTSTCNCTCSVNKNKPGIHDIKKV